MARKVTKAAIRKTAATAASKGRGGSIRKATQAQAMYGNEPTPIKSTSEKYNSYLVSYFNWANNVFESSDLKEHFMTYAKENKIETSDISGIPAGFFASAGKISYLINTGKEITDTLKNNLEKEIEYIRAVAVKRKAEEERISGNKPEDEECKVPKHLEEYWSVYTAIDSFIDAKKVSDQDIIQVFSKIKPSIRAAKMVQEHYSEDKVAWDKETGDRAYKKIIKTSKEIYETICSQINSYIVNTENTKSAVRKPRTKKAKPAIKLVEKLQYMKTDNKLGITSIAPESIVGANVLLVFNTKTRKFGIIRAGATAGGLSVKGSTIININEEKSICKTVRKPEEMLSKLTGSTITRTEKLFKEIKAVETLQKGRMSADILLLKVFK